MRRFVIRTIRDGTITFNGRVFRPSASPGNGAPYDGRLDGQRWAFGTYISHPGQLHMWGTEAAYRASTEEEYYAAFDAAPNVFAYEGQAGVIHWMTWMGDNS